MAHAGGPMQLGPGYLHVQIQFAPHIHVKSFYNFNGMQNIKEVVPVRK
jgi:hypothetical protein